MKLREQIEKYGSKVAIGAGLMVAAGTAAADATLPAGVSDMFSTIENQATALFDMAWPVAVVIVGGLVLFGLVKKVFRKATG